MIGHPLYKICFCLDKSTMFKLPLSGSIKPLAIIWTKCGDSNNSNSNGAQDKTETGPGAHVDSADEPFGWSNSSQHQYQQQQQQHQQHQQHQQQQQQQQQYQSNKQKQDGVKDNDNAKEAAPSNNGNNITPSVIAEACMGGSMLEQTQSLAPPIMSLSMSMSPSQTQTNPQSKHSSNSHTLYNCGWSSRNTLHVDDLMRNFELNPKNGVYIGEFNEFQQAISLYCHCVVSCGVVHWTDLMSFYHIL